MDLSIEDTPTIDYKPSRYLAMVAVSVLPTLPTNQILTVLAGAFTPIANVSVENKT